ncbi:hypothetical protein CR513_59568, partial [Mucuna pruriens]
ILENGQHKVRTRSTFKDQAQVALLFNVEPKNVEDALMDNGWIKAIDRIERKNTNGGCHFIGANLFLITKPSHLPSFAKFEFLLSF